MKALHLARHAAHAGAHDPLLRFIVGVGVAGLGAALWLAEVARMLAG